MLSPPSLPPAHTFLYYTPTAVPEAAGSCLSYPMQLSMTATASGGLNRRQEVEGRRKCDGSKMKEWNLVPLFSLMDARNVLFLNKITLLDGTKFFPPLFIQDITESGKDQKVRQVRTWVWVVQSTSTLWASFMKHDQNKFLCKSFVKLFWHNISWKCLYFQTVIGYERNLTCSLPRANGA